MNEPAEPGTERARHIRPRLERLFYSGMATCALLTVLGGFARSYYLRGVIDGPASPLATLTPAIHVHAFAFTGWILLFIAQTSLVAAGRRALHRGLGMVALAWIPLMVAAGASAALRGVVRGTAPPFMEPRRWLAVQVFDLVVFATFALAGLRARRDPQQHKRLMLLSTLALLPPALGRSPLPPAILRLGAPGIFAVADLSLVPLVVWDLGTRGRIHRATLSGGLLLVISLPLRLAVAKTEAWAAFADVAVNLVP